jgi:hypothetical protein
VAGFHVPVSPPGLLEPVISLLHAANDPLQAGDETDGRWVNGISFQPHDNSAPWVRDSCDGSGTNSPGYTPGLVDWQAYVIGVDDTCSAMGYQGHQFKDRLDMRLKVGRHKAVETEFWGGALASAESYPNAWLTKIGVTNLSPTGSAPTVHRAFEILEQGLADCGLGGRGMIHCRPEALPYLTTIRRVGNLILTARDTIVVAGTGYPNTGPGGSAPAAGNTWLFATGMVDVRLDSKNVNYYTVDPLGRTAETSGFTDDEIVMNMNRSTNTITTRAEMFALASWDEQCWLACNAVLDS